MHRAQESLTTGTYVAICNLDKDDSVAKVEAKGNGHALLGTKNRKDENTEVRTLSTLTGMFFIHKSSLVAY